MDNTQLIKVIAALSSGQLPEMAEKLKEEAARRWPHGAPGGLAFSEEAQRIKMEKAAAKRLRRKMSSKLA